MIYKQLPVICLLLLFASPSGAEAPDVKKMVASSLEKGRGEDRAAWSGFAFRRRVTRQKLDAEGEVSWGQEMLFQVTPTAEGFEEEIIEIDGREPTAKEVAEHRKAGRFEKHYATSADVAIDNPFGSDLALLPLVYEQEHRYAGEEEVDGIPCHRIRWEARPEPAGQPVEERLKHAMKGSVCLATDGNHLVQTEMQTVRPVAKGPVRIHSMRLRFEVRQVEDAWLPAVFEMRSELKLPGKKMRKHNIYRYSDYRRADGSR